jgi:hypothetical protein
MGVLGHISSIARSLRRIADALEVLALAKDPRGRNVGAMLAAIDRVRMNMGVK